MLAALGNRCVVDDFPALMVRLPMSLPAKHYTTSLVLGEVRDWETRLHLEMVLDAGLIEVREVPEGLIREVLESLPSRLASRLSRPDASLLALARLLEDECETIMIATDDYALQEAAARLGYQPVRIRYRGSRSLQRWRGGRP